MWCALIPHAAEPEAHAALALWALSFTPRVACVGGGVLLDTQGCTRLWGGARALRTRLAAQAPGQGVARWAWGATGLAALARARAGVPDDAPLAALPLHLLDAAAPHRVALGQVGCRTLGQLRALPRAGVARRWGQPLLDALDRLHGQQPETYRWVQPPDTFAASLELPASVAAAPALVFAAQRLLGQLQGWLTARGLGAVALHLSWRHEGGAHRRPPDGGVHWGMGRPTRDAAHLGKLLAEHLARVRLPTPVAALTLRAPGVQPLVGSNAQLWPQDPAQARLSDTDWMPMLERLAARLGPEQVRLPVVVDDQRLSARHRWASALTTAARPLPPPDHPEPAFVYPVAQPLAQPPRRLAGPQRLDDGWWAGAGRHEARDYWLAHDRELGLVWLYEAAGRWHLHGFF